jgi:hypothetical protein
MTLIRNIKHLLDIRLQIDIYFYSINPGAWGDSNTISY